MRHIDSKPLRAHLVRRLKSVHEQALQSEGELPANTVEPLERLSRLIELCEAAAQSPPRKRWPVALLLVCTLTALSILLFVRVSHTDVELNVKVSEVRFRLPSDQVLSDVLNLSALRVTGLKAVQLPPEVRGAGAGFAPSESIILVGAAGGETANVTLAPLIASDGTQITLRSAGVPGQFRVSLEHFKKELRADLVGSVRVGRSGSSVESVDFSTPRPVLLQPDTEIVDLDLTLPGPASASFLTQIQAAGLSLSRIDEFGGPDHTLVRHVSTILSGTLYLESLNGQSRELRAAEPLRFAEAQGAIRELQLNQDHIVLKFQGRVRGMSTGPDTERRSLMPAYLEWLQARHGLALLWGSTLSVFGLVIAAARWWGARW